MIRLVIAVVLLVGWLSAPTFAADVRATEKLCRPSLHLADRAAAPIYLLHDLADTQYTLSVATGANGNSVVSYRAVTASEIDRLCTSGMDVRSLPDPAAARNAKAHARSGLVEPLPSSFSIVKRYGVVYGNFWIAGATPANVTTQWVAFTLQTANYNGTAQHIPIALFLDADALSGSGPQIVGNGMLIGDVHNRTIADGGCGSASWPGVPIYNSQIEAFWAGGNHIYGATCDVNGTYDGVAYDFVLAASTGSWVSYTKASPGQSYQSPAIYTLAQRPGFDPFFGGILFASTDDSTSGDFTLLFSEVGNGWF